MEIKRSRLADALGGMAFVASTGATRIVVDGDVLVSFTLPAAAARLSITHVRVWRDPIDEQLGVPGYVMEFGRIVRTRVAHPSRGSIRSEEYRAVMRRAGVRLSQVREVFESITGIEVDA